MKKEALTFWAVLALTPALVAASIYGPSLSRLLKRRFPEKEISYLLVDLESGRVVSSRWDEPRRPVPLGSIVKPFGALAYAQAHGYRYPRFTCRGEAGGCWYAAGHGRLDITAAVAHSCNAYFRQLAEHIEPAAAHAVLRRFGLSHPEAGAPPQALIGLGEEWKLDPLAVIHAYAELAARRGEPGVRELVQGMALAAQVGTGKGVGQAVGETREVLVKTGTAPCGHGVEWSGDGYVLMLEPARSPRTALLVRVHGKPGAEAANVGGQMMRAVLEGE